MSDEPHVTSWSPVIDEGETIATLRARLATAEGLLREARPIIHAGAQQEIDAGVNLTDVMCGTGGLLISIDEFLTPTPPVSHGEPTPRAICTHPGFDVDGKCYTCGDIVASAFPVEFAKRVAAIYATPTPPPCASWCETAPPTPVPVGAVLYWDQRANERYCTPACRDASRPLNPATPTNVPTCRCGYLNAYGQPCPTCTPKAPMTSPLYLRDLALKFAATKRPRDLAIAERLRAIADELDGVTTTPAPRPPRDLTRGIDAKLAEMRRVPAPTPAELEAIRGLIARKP